MTHILSTLRRLYFRWLRNYHDVRVDNALIGIMQAKNEIRHHKAKAVLAEYRMRNE